MDNPVEDLQKQPSEEEQAAMDYDRLHRILERMKEHPERFVLLGTLLWHAKQVGFKYGIDHK